MEQAGQGAGDGELTVVGGGTKSSLVTQLLADVLGRSVVVRPDASWPAIGAAQLAATATGWDIEPGAALQSVKIAPRPSQSSVMDDRYQRYLSLRTEGCP